MKVLVTGSNGFVGRNLCVELARREGIELLKYDVGDHPEELNRALAVADVIYHLAGVNRPQKEEEYQIGNVDFTMEICHNLAMYGRKPKIVLSSSIQAELDNPYGMSKRGAEEILRQYTQQTGGEGVVYRLKNLFGKWCRPNYNSVTATFCYNIAHDMPIQVSNADHILDLSYIDDVVAAFVKELDEGPETGGFRLAEPLPSYPIALGELADLIRSFHAHRKTLILPDFSTPFVRALYATYLSYLDPVDLEYGLDIKSDSRGSLAEFIKSSAFGQIFISRTEPGITRGHHFHNTKAEKFMVVEGEAIIRLRQIEGQAAIEYRVHGEEYRVVDIPPGYAHSIENIGPGQLITLFWASEIFSQEKPDTVSQTVVK